MTISLFPLLIGYEVIVVNYCFVEPFPKSKQRRISFRFASILHFPKAISKRGELVDSFNYIVEGIEDKLFINALIVELF